MSACWRSRCSWSREGGGERLVVNEIAPRVHNSGHWTWAAPRRRSSSSMCAPSAAGRSATTARLGRVEMKNLIGDDADAWEEILAEPGRASPPLRQGRGPAGRKMGHVTRVFPETG